MSNHCIVRKKKYDGSIKSEWQGELLDSAESNYLIVRHHPEKHTKFANGIPVQADRLFLHYLNTVQPLTILVSYDEAGHFIEAKFDAALPATIEGDVITFVDLDLDIILNSDFSWYLQDEDDFAQHRVAMNYPNEVVRLAWEGINSAEKIIADKTYPFPLLRT